MFDDGIDFGRVFYRVLQLYIMMLVTVSIGVVAFAIFFNTGSFAALFPDSLVKQIAVASTGAYVGLAIVVGVIIHGFNR